MGIIAWIVLGLIADWIGWAGIGTFFEVRTWIVAIAGAVLLLLVYRLVTRDRQRGHALTG